VGLFAAFSLADGAPFEDRGDLTYGGAGSVF
jgi:hypothetical protein